MEHVDKVEAYSAYNRNADGHTTQNNSFAAMFQQAKKQHTATKQATITNGFDVLC